MLKEGAEKESRGWKYKELEIDIPTKGMENKVLENDLTVEGVQMNMFE